MIHHIKSFHKKVVQDKKLWVGISTLLVLFVVFIFCSCEEPIFIAFGDAPVIVINSCMEGKNGCCRAEKPIELCWTNVRGVDTYKLEIQDGNGYVEILEKAYDPGNGRPCHEFTYSQDSTNGGFTHENTYTFTVTPIGEYQNYEDSQVEALREAELEYQASIEYSLCSPKIQINPATDGTNLTTSEDVDIISLEYELNVKPTADVKLTLSVIDKNADESQEKEGKIIGANPLVFTPQNWRTSKIVFIQGIDDFIIDSESEMDYTIHAEVESDDEGYAPSASEETESQTEEDTSGDEENLHCTFPDCKITNDDNDVAGVVLSNLSSPYTTETGGVSRFSMQLATQPDAGAEITIKMESSNTDEGVVEPSQFTFTENNWNFPVFVTITGQYDNEIDGDVSYDIEFTNETSGDSNYASLQLNNKSLINKEAAYSSCLALKNAIPTLSSDVYPLEYTDDGITHFYYAYCDMSYSDGGWTLALKVDGTQNTFTYHSPYWINDLTFPPNTNETDVYTNILNELKSPAFSHVEFSKVYIKTNTAGTEQVLIVETGAESLKNLVSTTTNINVGDGTWAPLITGSNLFTDESIDGFNVELNGFQLRMGYIGEDPSDNISFLGIGAESSADPCGSGNSAGTLECNGALPNTDIATFAYIYIK